MIGKEYQLYHEENDFLGRRVEDPTSDFFMAMKSQEGQVACSPGVVSPFSRTLQMSIYNSATTTSVPSCDRTCLMGANAGLTGYNNWQVVFQDQFSVDSGPAGTEVWFPDPTASLVNFKWAGGYLQYRVSPASVFANSVLRTGYIPAGPAVMVPVMKTDRPARITFKWDTAAFSGTPTVQVSAGNKLTGQTDGIIRNAPGTYSEVYPTVGDGVVCIYFATPGFPPVQNLLLDWIVVEQMGNDTVSQGTCITVGVNGQQIGAPGSADPEIGGAIGNDGLAALGNDTLANPFRIKGLRIVSRWKQLFQNLWTIRYTMPTGKVNTITYAPQNHLSPTNANGLVVDDPNFDFPVDGNLSICTRTPWVETTSQAYWVIIFTIEEEVNNSGHIFFNQPLQQADTPRPTGNPIVGMLNEGKKVF